MLALQGVSTHKYKGKVKAEMGKQISKSTAKDEKQEKNPVG